MIADSDFAAGVASEYDDENQEVDRNIRYSPWPSQIRFHESTARFKGFSSSVGGGKSLALVHEAIKLSVENPGLPGLIGAPTYAMLRDATQRAFFEVLEENELPYLFFKAENRLVMSDTGSEILFRSMDAPERLRGPNLAWYGIDELSYCTQGAWTRMLARLRHPRAQHLVGFGCWTPKGFNWVYDLFVGEKKQPGYELIRGVPFENTAVAAGYYDELAKGYDARFYEQEVLGEYLPLFGNRVYYAFDRASSNVQPLEYNPSLPIYWSLDFNVALMCSVIGQIEDRTTRTEMLQGKTNRVANIIDEIALPNANVDEVCNEFKRRMEPLTRRGPITVMLYGDASGGSRTHAGPSTYQIIRQNFMNEGSINLNIRMALANGNITGQANPPVQSRVNAMNAMLLNHSGDRRLSIDPRCKTLIADLEQVSWKQDVHENQTADLDKTNKLLTHVSDSCGYLIEAEFGLKPRGRAMAGAPPIN
jgi:hypothetical protein